MKNAATIFLLSLMVSIQTPFGQLLKLPVLVEHYLKHQEQERVSPFDFLQDHYASDHNDADLPEDEQLPFKKINFIGIGFAIVPPVIKANAVSFIPAGKKIMFPDIYTPQLHLAIIFHPPRV